MGLGIKQGRLSPPEDGRFNGFPRAAWRDEFPRAVQAGLTAIEWIWDAYGADVNPLATESGQAELLALAQEHGIALCSICADYFMDFPLVRADGETLIERKAALNWLTSTAGKLGIKQIVLPFLDASRVQTADELDQVVQVLRDALPVLEAAGVNLHIEADFAPLVFAEFLSRLPHAMIKVNYDSGNSASLGYLPADEWAAYGSRVGSVHLKDRVAGGATVPLGTGAADFAELEAVLRQHGFAGNFVLECARGIPGDEVEWARTNLRFAELHGLIGGR